MNLLRSSECAMVKRRYNERVTVKECVAAQARRSTVPLPHTFLTGEFDHIGGQTKSDI